MGGFIKSLDIRGQRELREAFQAKRKRVFDQLDPACKEATDMVTAAAQRTSLFTDRSGQLRSVIKTKLRKRGKVFIRYQSGPAGRLAPHGQLVELGHKLVRGGKEIGVVEGRHYMEAAFNTVETAAEARIEMGVKQAMA